MDLVPFENTFVTKSHIFVALKKMRDTIKYRTVMKGRYPQKGDLGGFDSNLLICAAFWYPCPPYTAQH